jgi:hypothetical protein
MTSLTLEQILKGPRRVNCHPESALILEVTDTEQEARSQVSWAAAAESCMYGQDA